MSVVTAISDIPPLRAREARALVAIEVERMVALLSGLDDAEWQRPTPCERWSVRDVLAHLVGEGRDFSGATTFPRMVIAGSRIARREHLPLAEGMTEWQVLRRRHRSPSDLLADLPRVARRVGRLSRVVAGPLRHLPAPIPGVGIVPLSFLTESLFLRDIWVHRHDLSHALGRPFVITRDHDARVVAILVAEWGKSHETAVRLELGGQAGDIYVQGRDGECLAMDAVEFVLVLSGRRSHGHGLMAGGVRF